MGQLGRPTTERRVVICEACGLTMERRVTDIKRNKTGRFFCSAECRNKIGVKPSRGAEKPCQQCANPVYVPPGDRGRIRFCSRACCNLYQARNAVRCKCETCGREYRLSPSQAGHRKLRFCSKRCEGDARLKRPLDRMHNGRPAALDNQGYVRISEPSHPKAMNGGWIFEHRWVVEQVLGRTLRRDEAVHHVNGIKDDNRLENLEVMDALDHLVLSGAEYRTEQQGLRADLAEYIKRFGPLDKDKGG